MAPLGPVAIGIDVGTSGCRAVALDMSGTPIAGARTQLPAPSTPRDGWVEQDPETWWQGVLDVLGQVSKALPRGTTVSVAVDGTSATLLLADPSGRPLGPALMYNDRRATEAARRISEFAPAESAALGAGSSLGKLLWLDERLAPAPGTLALHQADWIGGRLADRFGWSDWNNALKLGFEPDREDWPGWILDLVPARIELPQVLHPGARLGPLDPRLGRALGFGPDSTVMAGTTDSTAAVVAAGARETGDAVTCLGSTLVIKVVSPRPVASAEHGVYSHRLGDRWLVGGASNSGGAVLAQYFEPPEILQLSAGLDTTQRSGLDYYPLARVGERFPRNDPGLAPRIEPIPRDRSRLLLGLLEGMAAIEAEGYRLLCALGAPRPTRILSIGGGAANPAWTRLRARALGIPVQVAALQEAAQGAALLALWGRATPPVG